MFELKETATKAFTAAVLAFVSFLGATLYNGDGTLTTKQLGLALGAAALAFVATFSIPNKPIAKGAPKSDPLEGLEEAP